MKNALVLICAFKLAIKFKGKFYRTTTRPTMFYITDCLTIKCQYVLTEQQEQNNELGRDDNVVVYECMVYLQEKTRLGRAIFGSKFKRRLMRR